MFIYSAEYYTSVLERMEPVSVFFKIPIHRGKINWIYPFFFKLGYSCFTVLYNEVN